MPIEEDKCAACTHARACHRSGPDASCIEPLLDLNTPAGHRPCGCTPFVEPGEIEAAEGQ